jgi:hypothetical protein
MNIKLLSAALGLALTTGAITANAQKEYKSGVISFPTEVRGQPADAKTYFSPDSSATVVTFGAGNFKMLTSADHKYVAVVLDIPVAGIKKAGIATPAEMEEFKNMTPTFTYTTTTEAKQISGFNCVKVVAKDTKSGKTYDIWVTKDVTLPETALPFYYRGIGGTPIQYTSFNQGEEVSVTVKSITGDAAPAGTYGISKDFEKGPMSSLTQGQ